MSDSKLQNALLTAFLFFVVVLFFGELAVLIACCCYAFCAAREYVRIARQAWHSPLPSGEQFSSSQRLYGRFIRSNLPFGARRDEVQQWLDEHSGRHTSFGRSLRGVIRGILFALSALMVWPCAMLIHGLVLGFRACRET